MASTTESRKKLQEKVYELILLLIQRGVRNTAIQKTAGDTNPEQAAEDMGPGNGDGGGTRDDNKDGDQVENLVG